MTNVERQVARLGKFSKVRPSGVRDLKLTGSKLTWTEPADTKYITHYYVRVGTDQGNPAYQVPVGQNSCAVAGGDTDFWVSAANKTMGTESPMAYALGTASIGAAGSVTVRAAHAESVYYAGAVSRNLEEKLGEQLSVLDLGAKADLIELSDIAITSGTATATSASSVFTFSDIGKLFGVDGAGASGGPLAATIAGLVDAHTVTLSVSAGTTVSGAAGHYGTDNRQAFQRALDIATGLGRIQVIVPAGGYLIADTLWIQSNTQLIGQGGRSRVSRIKRHHGMYTDLIVAGTHNEGTNVQRYVYAWWHNGKPYNCNLIGENISICGLYLDGNNLNSGCEPTEPNFPLGSYHGSNIWIQWVNGVQVDDLWTDRSSNDGLGVFSSRRVIVTSSTFSNAKLYRQQPLTYPTKNGLTIAGTQSAVDATQKDMLIVQGCIAEANADLGIAIQARNMETGPATDIPGTAPFGGTIVVHGCITRKNGVYGIGVEGGVADSTTAQTENVIVSACVSDGDAISGELGAVAIGQKTRSVQITGLTIRDSGASGLLLAPYLNTAISNLLIDGFGLVRATGVSHGIMCYKESAVPTNPQYVTVENVTIRGGAGRPSDTMGVAISSVDQLFVRGLRIDGTTLIASDGYKGSGLYVSCTNAMLSGIWIDNAAAHGARLQCSGRTELSEFTITNYAKGSPTSFSNGIYADTESAGNGNLRLTNGRVRGPASHTANEFEAISIALLPNVEINGVVVENAATQGIIATCITGKVILRNVRVSGYATSSVASSITWGVQLLISSGAPQIELDSISVSGGDGKTISTGGITIPPVPFASVKNCRVDGTTWTASGSGAGNGLNVYSTIAQVENNTVLNCADCGIYLDGVVTRATVTRNTVYNNGKSTSAPLRAGIFAAPGTGSRYGLIEANLSFDDQGSPTQNYGIQLPNATTDFFDLIGNKCWGNALLPLNGEVNSSGNRIYGNTFTHANKLLQLGNNGGISFYEGPIDKAGSGTPTGAPAVGSIWRQTDAGAGHSGLWLMTPDGWQEAPIGALTGKSLTLDDTHPFLRLKKSTVLKFEVDEDGKVTQSASLNIDSAAPSITLKNAGTQKFAVDGSGNVTAAIGKFDGPTGSNPFEVYVNGVLKFSISSFGDAQMANLIVASGGQALINGDIILNNGSTGGKVLQTNASTFALEEIDGATATYQVRMSDGSDKYWHFLSGVLQAVDTTP